MEVLSQLRTPFQWLHDCLFQKEEKQKLSDTASVSDVGKGLSDTVRQFDKFFVWSVLRPLDISWCQCEFFSTCGEAHFTLIIVNLDNLQY